MKKILVIDLGTRDKVHNHSIWLLGQQIEIDRIGCQGDIDVARHLIANADHQYAAIALEGLPAQLRLGNISVDHTLGSKLNLEGNHPPIVTGSAVRAGLERWSVVLTDRAQPGIFSQKRILLVPGLQHDGLAQAFTRHSEQIRYADPVVYFGLPDFPGVGSRRTLDRVARLTLEQLKDAPFRRIFPQAGRPGTPRAARPFQWADILAGDIGAILRYAPSDLRHKTIVVDSASEEELEQLRARGASIAVMLIPNLDAEHGRQGWGYAMIEASLAVLSPNPVKLLEEDTYLDLIASLDWKPDIRYLQPEEQGINRFAFVIHPLSVKFIHEHRLLGWTKYLPNDLIEWIAAWMPPVYLSRITGGQSPLTGQRIEGILLSLGATPHQMMKRGERFTYTRLNQAARMAARKGARIMGLGAFTSVVGDAGITVAHESDIAITSGNSLTVAATLEAAKQAVIKMGVTDLTQGRAMVIGATGSIGSVCARMIAQAILDVVLVSIEPEKLIELKRRIQIETPNARVIIATRPDETLSSCDLIITATSAFGQRILNLSQCKPGAIICDVARPQDISPSEAALRPDILVIESGEVIIPGNINFGYDIGLPPKTSYACLAETALLAMEGRFEDYTLGRNISIEQVKEIYHLFQKHQFQLAGLRSFGRYITDDDMIKKRAIADQFRSDALLFGEIQQNAMSQIARLPVISKGVTANSEERKKWGWLLLGLGLVGITVLMRRQLGRTRR